MVPAMKIQHHCILGTYSSLNEEHLAGSLEEHTINLHVGEG